jgi:hypothetical protein
MRFVAILFMLVYSILLQAQIINIEDKRLGFKEDGWNGNIDFNFKFTKNSNSVWQINNRIAIQHRTEKQSHLIISDQSFVSNNSNNIVNYGFAHYRYSKGIYPDDKIKFEAFTQLQYNSVQKIKVRSLLGSGLRFKVIGNDSANLNLGWSFMYEYEEITTPEYNNAIRNSNYISFNAKIGKEWSFKNIIYYQPNVGDFSDFRISNESTISHSLTKHISILGSISFLYDSKPPLEVPLNIFSTSLMIRYKF